MPENSLIKIKYFKILLIFFFTVSGMFARNAALLYNSGQLQNPSQKHELQKWENLLLKWNIHYRLVALDDFDGGDIEEYSLAIGFNLTNASRSELSELAEFVSNGGALILDSSVFGQGDNSSISDKDFWKKRFYFLPKRLEQRGMRSSLILKANTQLSIGIENGFRFPAGKNNVSFEPKTIDLYAGGYFDNAENEAGIIYGTIDSGKIVCFGFDVDPFSLNNDVSKKLKKTVWNAFEWLNNEPQIWVGVWPGNYSSAVAFVCNVETNSPGGFEAVRFFSDENIRPTFILNAKKYSDGLLEEMMRTGEISFRLNEQSLNGSNIVSGFISEVKKFKNINRLTKLRIVKGVRIESDKFLNITKNVSRPSFEYVLTSGNFSEANIVFWKNGLLQFNSAGFNEEIQRKLFVSDRSDGLFIVECNSSVFVQNENPFEDFVNELNELNCWVAPLGQIADWIKTTNNIQTNFTVIDDSEIEITVENKNIKTAYGTKIFLNDFFFNYQIKNENINVKYYQTGKKLTKLIINKIEPKQKEFFKLQKVNMVVKN